MPPRPARRSGAYDQAISETLRELRAAHGLTRRDVAEALEDVTEAMVGFWERGDSRVTVVTLMRLAIQVYRKRPSELMSEIEVRLLDHTDDHYWE